jgi:PAS domain S-box-containing protein
LRTGDKYLNKQTKTILIVEDSRIFQKVLQKGLEALGYEVFLAKTLKDALDILEKQSFDMIVLDLNLPDGEGEDILLSLSVHKKLRIIVYTSDIDKERRDEWFRYGVLNYLCKSDPFPYVIGEIDKTLKAVIENRQHNILIIDDSRFICKQIKSLLQAYSYNTAIALSGAEAKKELAKTSFDLIILDLELPDMHGSEILTFIRKTTPALVTPVFILTGQNDNAVVAKLVKQGANEFFTKPFCPEEFLLKIDFWMGIKRLNRQKTHGDNTLREYQKAIDESVIVSKTDKNGIITYANEQFCKISGYETKELIGQKHSIIRHCDTPNEIYVDMWKTITSKKIWHGVIGNRSKNGEKYIVKSTITPILDENNDIEAYIAIREDITQIEKARINSEALARAKSEFLANMSHEIRTPLNAIVGFVSLLKEEDTGRKSMKYIDIIEKSSYSLLKIIEDILDFSKIESGKLGISETDFNSREEFEIITHLFLAKCSEKNISLILDIDESVPLVIFSDSLRIKQVIANLISNAIKFSDFGKNIKVSISYNDGFLSVTVKDEGKGIAKDKLKHIFEAFNQEDTSITREFGGTGLGLSISAQLVNLLGGDLKVKSELGIGSEFYFSIPVKIGKETKTDNIDMENIDFKGHKILLVEDNKSNQLFMTVLLRKLKLNHDIANNGIEAIEKFKQSSYDAILMDENMPKLNGTEATKEILNIEKTQNLIHTPIIALTANAIKGDRERFLKAGMDEYLTKPVEQSKLRQILAKFLGTR